MPEQLLKSKDVQQLLSVSKSTLARMRHRGDLPTVRLPSGALRFRESDIERLQEPEPFVPLSKNPFERRRQLEAARTQA